MTLKEKVQSEEPTQICDGYPGGVMGCPGCYSYLNDPNKFCDAWMEEPKLCEECWNCEYKESANV